MSILYKSPFLYHLCMRIIYGPTLFERYRIIAERIPEGASVVDLCCGDCYLYSNYLKKKNVSYLGIDQSANFQKNAVNLGIDFKVLDVAGAAIPEADYIVMMGSLYQFIPHEEETIKKLFLSARKELIICEPVRNLANSKNFILRAIARIVTYPKTARFDRENLDKVFEKFNVFKTVFVCKGREAIGIFKKQGCEIK